MDESTFIQEIVDELTLELINSATFDTNILNSKVKDAYRKVKSRRCYKYTTKTQEEVIGDMYDNYYQDIKDLALYNYAKIGGYFENSHSENGTSRTWRTEDEILGNIISFVKVL